jgi:hypothetical protein
VLVGVGDAAVMLFFELVLFGVGRGIAPQPELLDELIPLFVGTQTLKRSALFISDDVDDVLVEPVFVGGFQLFAKLGLLLPALLFGQRLCDVFARAGRGLALLLSKAQTSGQKRNERQCNR